MIFCHTTTSLQSKRVRASPEARSLTGPCAYLRAKRSGFVRTRLGLARQAYGASRGDTACSTESRVAVSGLAHARLHGSPVRGRGWVECQTPTAALFFSVECMPQPTVTIQIQPKEGSSTFTSRAFRSQAATVGTTEAGGSDAIGEPDVLRAASISAGRSPPQHWQLHRTERVP